MRLAPGYTFAALLLCLLLNGCSSSPSEQQGRDALFATVSRQVRGAPFEITSFRKTNGIALSGRSVRGYQMLYEANLRFPDGYRSECVGQTSNLECMNPMIGGPRPMNAGSEITATGSITFIDSERGWIPSGQIALTWGTARGPQTTTSPTIDNNSAPARDASALGTNRHFEILINASGPGQCDFQWERTQTTASQLRAVAVRELETEVARQGGASNVTHIPTVWARAAATTPYRCLSGALREIQRAGFTRARLVPSGPTDHQFVIDLPQASDGVLETPEGDPVRNIISINAGGTITWNGSAIDTRRLRQYLDYVNTMTPVPELHVRPDPQTSLRDVAALLGLMSTADIRDFLLFGTDIHTRRQFVMYSGFNISPDG